MLFSCYLPNSFQVPARGARDIIAEWPPDRLTPLVARRTDLAFEHLVGVAFLDGVAGPETNRADVMSGCGVHISSWEELA